MSKVKEAKCSSSGQSSPSQPRMTSPFPITYDTAKHLGRPPTAAVFGTYLPKLVVHMPEGRGHGSHLSCVLEHLEGGKED